MLYPNYAILFQKKDKLVLYGEDKLLLYSCKFSDIFNNISYIIVDNLEVVSIKENDNNLFDFHLSKGKFIDGLNKLKRKDFINE